MSMLIFLYSNPNLIYLARPELTKSTRWELHRLRRWYRYLAFVLKLTIFPSDLCHLPWALSSGNMIKFPFFRQLKLTL